MNLFKQAYFI